MPFEAPRMLPGQEPYTEEEHVQLQRLLNAAIDEEETGGFPVGSPEWMAREIRLDAANDQRKREGR